MNTQYTTSFNEARKICKAFARLIVSGEDLELLNSGKVLYYFNDTPPGWVCWPYFPIGNHRSVVKDLNKKGVSIPVSVKVIIEVGLFYGNKDIASQMLDCFGHTLLYLISPKASNECEDAVSFINELGIYYK